jgi:1,4-dihydroxy-2-naphthoyl-CoA hydrolase
MIDNSVSLQMLNKSNQGNMSGHLGLEYTCISSEYLTGRIPVDERNKQQLGMMHGGAAAFLAETLGSMAAYLSVDREKYYTVGLEIKCNHLKPVMKGYVTAKAVPVHLGTRTQVWQIHNYNDENELVTLSTLTVAVLELNASLKKQFRNHLGPLYQFKENGISGI